MELIQYCSRATILEFRGPPTPLPHPRSMCSANAMFLANLFAIEFPRLKIMKDGQN